MGSSRGKIPPSTAAAVIAFVVVGFVGFHTLRERSSSTAALDQKEFEIVNLHLELNKVIKTSEELQRAISMLKAERSKLATDTDNLSSQLVRLEQYKGSTEDKKRRLEDVLQSKEDEVDELKEQLAKLQQSSEELKELKQQVRELEEKLNSSEVEHAQEVRRLNLEKQNSVSELREEIDRLRGREATTAEKKILNTTTSADSEEKDKDLSGDNETEKLGGASDESDREHSEEQKKLAEEETMEDADNKDENIDSNLEIAKDAEDDDTEQDKLDAIDDEEHDRKAGEGGKAEEELDPEIDNGVKDDEHDDDMAME